MSGVSLSLNLTGAVFVNQTAAFSDFHGTGANPAANAALSDSAFVANRFRVVRLENTCDPEALRASPGRRYGPAEPDPCGPDGATG